MSASVYAFWSYVIKSQALALTRNCKSPTYTTTPATNEISSRESAEKPPTPPSCIPAPLDATVSPSPIKEDFDSSRNPSAKSLPVHCIVEGISTLNDKGPERGVWRRRPVVETDSYVIIPVGTPFHNLVQVALMRLGYPQDTISAARGSVMIKNWKPLSFDKITADPMVTVGEILGELSNIATLKIQVFRARPGSTSDIKDRLLRFMLLQSHGCLLSSGCPLDELTLAKLCQDHTISGGPIPEVSDDIKRKFDHWWRMQFSSPSPAPRTPYNNTFSSPYCTPPTTVKTERTMPETSHPALQTVHNSYPTPKARMRTSFDPELELPKLQRWFTENQHPSRQQIQQYVKELNNLESRRGRKPLDVNNVVYWFKNARAAQKRAEVRNINPGMPCHIPLNGYNNHSPSNGGYLISESYLNPDRMVEHRLKNNLTPRRSVLASHTSDEYSNNGSDLEEDTVEAQQPPSPTAPLSLTKKSASREQSPQSTASPPPPPNLQSEPCKQEPKEEPINYHSPPPDVTNNNRLSDIDDDVEMDTDVKRAHSDTSPESMPSFKRICTSPEENPFVGRVPNDGFERLSLPLVTNSMFNQLYMSHYIPSLSHATASPSASNSLNLSADERRKRNRTFIDPVTEVPRLEQWFSLNTHPSHNLILKYTEDLNQMAYRQKFPRLEPKNVQFWFKNRRAKCKRMKMTLFDNQGQYHGERD
ncbi:homeobox protein dve-1 isoform X2 [Harmonia axyridis]|uniref:homeobox protein dve-1 isoform X2 n=1 Tax=Harmonia axyridis TaxID=115357 RepID=UPI001E277B14|nr:homeobox protein dve-1 isoform X2 [Harmonia axyridis]